jgi:hypothetical protein
MTKIRRRGADKHVWNSDDMSTQHSETRRVRLPLLERRRPMPATSSTIATGDAGFSIELVRNADVRPRGGAGPIVPRSRSELLNRAVNLVLAVIALIIASPAMLLVALAVKLTSRGPALYSQTRVGLDRRQRETDALYDRRKQDNGGQIFTIFKFRSMYVDAERDCGEVWATKDDPRVTAVGGFLRATRLDELPQLFNVLLGDMNIVRGRSGRASSPACARTCPSTRCASARVRASRDSRRSTTPTTRRSRTFGPRSATTWNTSSASASPRTCGSW